ncbi:MAG: hypothetical protein ACLRUN_14185 [Christensenellales bacterium]
MTCVWMIYRISRRRRCDKLSDDGVGVAAQRIPDGGNHFGARNVAPDETSVSSAICPGNCTLSHRQQHHVTSYFDGVVQTVSSKLLPGYIEQTIALGFMGKTPFLSAKIDGRRT